MNNINNSSVKNIFYSRENGLFLTMLILFLCISGLNSVYAQTSYTVTTPGMFYAPDTINCNVGDTINFILGPSHNAVEVDQATYNANGFTSNGGFNFGFGTTGSFVVSSAQTHYYVCSPHVTMGMKGVIIANALPVFGCTDSTALNYDPSATIDDGSCLGNPKNIFFSEYAEGSSNNKYLEIFNPSNDTVDLSNYALARVSNAPTNLGVYEYWVDFDSGSVILPNDVFIVAHPSADSLILAQADMGYGSLSNGDDGFGLIYGIEPISPLPPNNGYIVLDWIGDWNGDPGFGWSVAGVNAATRNHTLIRKCPVIQGDTSWNNAAGIDAVNSQWIVLPNNDWSNIGYHNTCICDSTTNSYTSIVDTICNGLSIIVAGNIYDSTGVYTDTLLAFNGCDSIITTHLTVLSFSASSTLVDTIICNGDSINLGSNFYTNSGTYIDTLFNASGCDSIVTLNLIVQTPINQLITICDGDSLFVGTSIYTSSGNYTDTIQSSVGCDSIVNTELIIYSQFNSIYGGIENNTIGGGSFYSGPQYLELSVFHNSDLISAVVYAEDTVFETFELRDDNGVVLQDTLLQVIPGGHRLDLNFTLLAGNDYQLGVNGNSNDLYRNNQGVNYPYNFGSLASITSSSAGANYYYFFYDVEMQQSNQPTAYSLCDGDSVLIGNSIYTTTGLYTDSLLSNLGCDSLVYTNLIVHSNSSYMNTQFICSGEVYTVNNNIYDSTGVYIDSLYTQYGCDSVITTMLTVLSDSTTVGYNNQVICFGDSITIGNNVYSNPGVYLDTLTSVNGCDSILTTTINITSPSYTSSNFGLLDTTIATGSFSNYNGHLILDASSPSLIKSALVYSQDTNSVTFELRDNNGVILQNINHSLLPGAQTVVLDFILPTGNDFQLGVDASNGVGLYRSNATIPYPFDMGPVSITSSNAGSQYYYYYYNIEIMPYATFNEINLCQGDSIIISGNVYNTTGNYIDTIQNLSFCDSIVHTNISIYQPPTLNIETNPDPPEICLGDTIVLEASEGFVSYAWEDGNNQIGQNHILIVSPTADQRYIVLATDSNGCVNIEDVNVLVDSCITTYNNGVFVDTDLYIYPIPAKDFINVAYKFDKDQAITLKIVDLNGRLILKTNQQYFKGVYSKIIDISSFKRGVYHLIIETQEKVINKKISIF